MSKKQIKRPKLTTKVCTECNKSKPDVRGRWVYNITDERPMGFIRVSKPYCNECYGGLTEYEG